MGKSNTPRMVGSWYSTTIESGTAITVPMVGAPMPCTVWVNLEAADIAAGTAITVSYSKNNGARYTSLAVVTTAEWEDICDSGVTHLKLQRTAGTGVTSTCGVC